MSAHATSTHSPQSGALLFLLTCLLISTSAHAAEPADDTSTRAAKPTFWQKATPAPGLAWSTFNGEHLVWLEGKQLQGVDPKTGLKRWEGGQLTRLRSVIQEFPGELLLVGEHLQCINTSDGKERWNYPLNCFEDGQCNADLIDRIPGRLLLGGFGGHYNMLMLLDSKDGSEVWPSWLSTCFFREAHIASDAVVVMCEGGSDILQILDIDSRVTRHAVPRPDPMFLGRKAWTGTRYAYVFGDIGDDAKLLVVDLKTGELVKRFNVKAPADDPSLGFRIVPDAGIFVPMKRNGDDYTLWGLDAATGKVQWTWKGSGLHFLTQDGPFLLFERNEGSKFQIGAINLSVGELAYTKDFYFQSPSAWALPEGILVASIQDHVFALLNKQTGNADVVGSLPNIDLPQAPSSAHVSWSEKRTTLVLEPAVILFENESTAEMLALIKDAIQLGNTATADALQKWLWPFRSVVDAAQQAYTLVVANRLLKACVALHSGDTHKTIELAREVLGESETWTQREYTFVVPFVARLAAGLAVSKGSGEERDDFLFEVIDLLINPRFKALEPEIRLGITLLIGKALLSGSYADAVPALLAPLSEDPALGPLYMVHPLTKQAGLGEIQRALDEANEAADIGDWVNAMKKLDALTNSPSAQALFDDDVEAWLDARSVKLLPVDLWSERIPSIIEGLNKAFSSRKKKVSRTLSKEACVSSCEVLQAVCPLTCVTARACEKSAMRCERGCAGGEPTWRFPAFSQRPDSSGFNQACQPTLP